MVLYSLLLPKAETTLTPEMYYHTSSQEEKLQLDPSKPCLLFQRGSKASFDSYFNSFSIEKWKKYACLDSLSLKIRFKGTFLITLYRHNLFYQEVITESLSTYTIDSQASGAFSCSFPLFNTSGVFSFSMEALEDHSVFYGGEYTTDTPEESLQEVNIAVTMCTYHREAYMKRNVSLLNRTIFSQPESPLYRHLRLYIADNGQSLNRQELENEFIHIFPQRSYGGSGGFVRGILEILNSREQCGHTHILIMDDDVIIEPQALMRNYSMLRLMKPEYRDRQIGGGMIRADIRYLQYEIAGQFLGLGIRSVKPHRDLRDLFWILDNEKEETHNYQAWFYSCIPIPVYLEKGFSLPFFMKADDVEYGLRQKPSITLNGVAVWHEAFESKDSFVSKYFCVRNETIVGCTHGMLTKKRVLKELGTSLKWHLFCYQYKALELHYRALEDFCKGVDWLKKVDARGLYANLLESDYARVPVDELDFCFDQTELFENIRQREPKWKQWFRRLTLNGWFFPARKDTVVSMTRFRAINFYRVKRVLFYNDYTGKAYLSERSNREFFKALHGYWKTRRLIQKNFDRVAREYRARKTELTSREFWENYLELTPGKSRETN